MNIKSIKSGISSFSNSAKNAVNDIGKDSIKMAKSVGDAIGSKIKIKTPACVDTFVKSAKEKSPQFVTNSFEYISKNKNTFVGVAVVLTAAASAGAIIKSVIDKVKETKAHTEGKPDYKISMHQG